jgi:penicillin-binding protein 1A
MQALEQVVEHLTQQLAKQLFHGEGSKFLPLELYRKEWIIAIRLERQYKEILAMYCNVYDFGNYSVG